MTAEAAPASEEGDALCPVCKGSPQHMRDVLADEDEVLQVLVLCEVCEQTGRVSRGLARALWGHQEPSA